MGFRYRKSFNLGGGFRVNLSKSGIGYSWGGKGFRITKTARGRTRRTFSIPGTGMSWVDESSGNGKKRVAKRRVAERNVIPDAPPTSPQREEQLGAETYRAADHLELRPASESALELIKQLDRRTFAMKILSGVSCAAVLFPIAGLASSRAFFVLSLVAAILVLIAATLVARNLRVAIEYEWDEDALKRENLRLELFEALNASQGLWQVAVVNETAAPQNSAGAANKASRKKARFQNRRPSFLDTNASCWKIDLAQGALTLLPDRAILKSGKRWSVVEYAEVRASVSTIKLAETTTPSRDATIVDRVWRYANADGSPDQSRPGNVRLPVCLCGVVSFETQSGFSVVFYLSNLEATKRVNALIGRLRGAF